MQKYIFSLLAAAIPLLFFVEKAVACSTCSFDDETNNYFLVMIVFMTSLPVICVGAVIHYLKKNREKSIAKNNEVAGIES